MDNLLIELLGVDSARTFNFFSVNLKDEVNRANYPADLDEMLYVVSVLAHYAQVSSYADEGVPIMKDLGEFFDSFVFNCQIDAEYLEIAGSQVIVLAGFFRDQMQRRHNVNWYDNIGQTLYDRASKRSRNPQQKELFEGIACSLPRWNRLCRNLSRTLAQKRYILEVS